VFLRHHSLEQRAAGTIPDYKGYDLRRYLPAIWWDIGELTPKVRYDVNDFLGWMGLEATFRPFIDWCSEHNVQARIQPISLYQRVHSGAELPTARDGSHHQTVLKSS